MIIELTEEDWIDVIRLVEEKAGPEYDLKKQNKFNTIKTKILFQFGMQNK